MGGRAREVYSDNNFDLEAQCVRCGKPVVRAEEDAAVSPILAIGPLAESGALDASAATLCSACANALGFQACYQAAVAGVADPRTLGCIYQVIGSPEEQATIETLMALLERSLAG
jgi:hypothetical protein